MERAIDRPRETKIIVNARPREVHGHEVTYQEIVDLAFPGAGNDANVIFSITYRGAGSHPSAGELGPGGAVEVREGTIFKSPRCRAGSHGPTKALQARRDSISSFGGLADRESLQAIRRQ